MNAFFYRLYSFLIIFPTIFLASCGRENADAVKPFESFVPIQYCWPATARFEMGVGSHTRYFDPYTRLEKVKIVYDSGQTQHYEMIYSGTNRIMKVIEGSGKYTNYDFNGDWSLLFRSFKVDPSITMGGNVTNGEIYEYNAGNQLIRKKISYLDNNLQMPQHVYYKQFEYEYGPKNRASIKREYKIANNVATLDKTFEYTYFEPTRPVYVNLGPILPEVDELSLKNAADDSDLFYFASVKEYSVTGMVNHYTYEYTYNLYDYPVKIIKRKNGNVVYTLTITYPC